MMYNNYSETVYLFILCKREKHNWILCLKYQVIISKVELSCLVSELVKVVYIVDGETNPTKKTQVGAGFCCCCCCCCCNRKC